MSVRPSNGQEFLWRDDGGPLVDRERAIQSLVTADPTLASIVEKVGSFEPTPPTGKTPFQYLLRAIAGQQLSVTAARTIYGRLVALYRPRRPTPTAVLATPEGNLRSAGLSRAKARAILDLARHAADRRLPTASALRALEPAEAIARLTTVRGVGPWTAEMVLMFYLGHPDILPVLDLGIQKSFGRHFRRGRSVSIEGLRRHGERWRPYRSIASWYLWRALDLKIV